MRINGINNYNYNKYTNKKSFEAKELVSNPNPAKKEKKNTKKIVIISSIAGALLLAFIFRNKIKDFFKGNKPGEKPKPPTEPPKPTTEPPKPTSEAETSVFDGQKILEEYRNLINSQKPFPSNGTEDEKAAWRKIDEHRMELRQILKNNNVSIVFKKEFPTNPLEMVQEKMNYLVEILSHSRFNMASQMDVINEYAKYGARYWIEKETGHSFILDLSVACYPGSIASTDEHKYAVAEKFIEIAERTTERDNTGMRDALKVIGTLERYAENMDEKLLLRYIELLKKISFQQVDQYKVYYATQHLQELPSVKKAMDEYKEILKQFPEKDRSKND